METITAGGRRTLPPVPRSAPEPDAAGDTRPPVLRRPPVPRRPPTPRPAPPPAAPRDDPGQLFVAALRAAAPGFAAAAGAVTAVVAEAVPPARHRRARCRLVLLTADGAETGSVFLGTAGRPGTDAAAAFTDGIARWLGGSDLAGRSGPGAPRTDVVVDLPG